MKISKLESFHLRVPYDEPEMQGGFCDLLFLRVDTDQGISGWGQAWSMKLAEATQWAIDHAIAPLSIGQNALETADWMERLLKSHGNTRQGPFTYAVSALDIALWDLKGSKRVSRSTHSSVERTNPALTPTRSFKLSITLK